MPLKKRKRNKPKEKGTRIENLIANMFTDEGFFAKRVPGSGVHGAADAKLKGDVRLRWENEVLKGESKGRKGGASFVVIERWLSGNDLLFLKRNYRKPLVVMEFETMIKLMKGSGPREIADVLE